MTTIVNYGMGNLGSILNMYKYIGKPARISSSLEDIRNAEKLLLPGVGAFDAAMTKINQTYGLLDSLLYKIVKEKTPVLGICLGMQLLTENSEEGVLPGLALIKGNTIKFPNSLNLKVPHMGWNTVNVINPSPLTKGLQDGTRFYFVHSYYVQVSNPNNQVGLTQYGLTFDSIIQNDNIFGAQFHPEKSHKFGMKLLENFANI